MNILILYATRGGATAECAQMLKHKLHPRHTVLCADIKEQAPSPEEFDVIALGSSITYGRADKRIRRYMKEYASTLNEKQTAVFFCCGYPLQFEEYAKTQIPKGLTPSLSAHCFGGELKPEKRSGLDKLIVRMMRNGIRSQDFEESDADHHPLPELIPENVALLVHAIEKLG